MTAPTELLDAEAMKKAAFAVFAKANENNLQPDKITSLWSSQHYPHWDGLAEAAIRAYLEAAPSPSPAPGVVMDDETYLLVERLLVEADWDSRAGEPLGKRMREASATISRLLNTIGDHISEKANLRVRIEKLEADLEKAREEYNIAVLYGDEQHIRAESFKEKAVLASLSQPAKGEREGEQS